MNENKPVKKFRSGRFQISIWVFRQLLSNGRKDSTGYIERLVDVERVCLQYSTKNRQTGEWENQSLWCALEDLRSLTEVLEQLRKEEDAPPSSDDDKSERDEVEGFSHSSEGKSPQRGE